MSATTRNTKTWNQSHFGGTPLTYCALTNALVSSCAGVWAQNSWHSRQGKWFVHNFGMFVSVHKIKLNSLLVPSSNLARQFPLQSPLPTQKQLQLINQVENPSTRNLSSLCSRVKYSSSWKTLAVFEWVQVQVLLFESMAVNESVHMIIRDLKGWSYPFSCNEIFRKYMVFNRNLLNVKYSKMGMHHVIWLTFILRTERLIFFCLLGQDGKRGGICGPMRNQEKRPLASILCFRLLTRKRTRSL